MTDPDELRTKTGDALRGLQRLIRDQDVRTDDLQQEVDDLRAVVSELEVRLAAVEAEQ